MSKPDRDPRLRLFQLRFRQIDATLAALGELLAALTLASQKLEADRREGWVHALDAVYRFLDTLDPYDADRTKVPINTLMAALRDLDRGKRDPGLELEPENRKKGGKSSHVQMVTRGVAAAAMDMLVKRGRANDAAGLSVARSLDKLGLPVGNRRTDTIESAGRTVEKWRERLNRGCDRAAQERYESAKRILRFSPGASTDDIEAGLPKILSEVLRGYVQKPD